MISAPLGVRVYLACGTTDTHRSKCRLFGLQGMAPLRD